MSFFAPSFDWRFNLLTPDERRAGAMGITITPANDAMGAWAEYVDGALITDDVYGFEVNFNSANKSNAVGNTLVDIGIDPAAGTSYQVVLPYLGACQAGTRASNGGQFYFFPLFIPRGSSIAARAQINNATVGTVRSFIRIFGGPTHPELIKEGRYVDAYGVDTTLAAGTAVTLGTTSEGAWTEIGTLSRDAWWWQMSIHSTDTSLGSQSQDWDLAIGDATNKRELLNPLLFGTVTGTAEELSFQQSRQCYLQAKAGETIYVRGQHGGTPDSGMSAIVYAMGG